MVYGTRFRVITIGKLNGNGNVKCYNTYVSDQIAVFRGFLYSDQLVICMFTIIV